ncbi:hypothetical protein [Euzebya sp.]|uniref:hypothetical protein n=1 Tax=Euzebya sp. TaxID=1971409 RepID=UPI003514774A
MARRPASSRRPAPSRRLAALCLAVLCSAALLTACADADGGGADQVTETPSGGAIPSTPPPAATPSEVRSPGPSASEGLEVAGDVSFPVTGELGLAEVEGGCAYIEVDGQRYELIADPDADLAVDGGNAVVASGDGEVIARAGDQITVDGSIDDGIATFCQIGPVIVASEVTAG